ncbi:MAG: peptidylprolyl isomerase [Draconibacterium sp.]|nr:peptidylprolyl isomerase [Draconibacterium sp.]
MLTTIILVLAHFGFSQSLPVVTIETTFGTIFCEIDTIHAPVTAYNFLNHIQKDTYKNAVFYRVVRQNNQPASKNKIEVIQGGLYADEEIDKIKPIIHETTKDTGIKHLDGTISMARNEPGTASTEFFICVGNQPELDYGGKRNPDGQGFAAFGQVIKGMEVVRKIQVQKVKDQYLVEPVRILKMKIK